ncbi:GNAT family N-acetyltransferase [Neptuniibacter sp. CAU 1671]|uniref:tRNA(Met) cytidine acetyltransferase TmcA n=1 Tax=Neptuniibacter sp. CAU 1671 TaxID=3032593 RepID=UPI0023DC3A89|nr:GNAT family N-acetyltransferase [Neptuniibacter sp. CAU 1671]MDF2181133.1 GNAT family N-acetyltransferase [Neptuniibacter sp. CAU 1671]
MMESALINRLKEQAVQQRHRRLLVFSGSPEWARQMASAQVTSESVWLGRHPPDNVQVLPARDAHRLLGQTLSSVIYDAWDGFNPNSFGQISGTLNGGGLLILLCPPLSDWPEFDDPEHQALVVEPYTTQSVGRRFISRVCRLLEDDPYTLIIQEGQPLPDSETLFSDLSTPPVDELALAAPPCATADQQQAVELIIRQLQRGRRPTVLTADRGRGKTTALGIAAAQLAGFDYQDILLTAPERSAVTAALNIAAELLPSGRLTDEGVIHDEGSIRFMLPEQLLEQPGEGQILLVDEAAAIPVPMLVRLLKRFPRIVFASTVHGYEGTGQGFTIRFAQRLNELAPQWKSCHLTTPIRWASDDPLEQLVFNLLLLNAEPLRTLEPSSHDIRDFSVTELDRDQLDEDYTTLQQLFGLLVLAHYRTTPGDLRILLDSPNLHIWLLQSAGEVAGAVLVAEEGPLPDDLVEAIWSGERRPRGHLLPQTLVHQEGYRMAAGLTCGRVMRLVVHPSLQRRGLGRQLLQTVAEAAQHKGWDYLGTSFALTDDLYSFWRACGYEMVRLGNQRDAVSGCFAALLLRPLSEAGQACVTVAEGRFARQFGLRLTDDWKTLETPLLASILAQVDNPDRLDNDDLSDLSGFIRHNRSYESSVYALNKLLRQALHLLSAEQIMHLMQDEGVVLLMQRVLQQQAWETLEQGGQGRRGLVRELRRAAGLLLDLLQADQ